MLCIRSTAFNFVLRLKHVVKPTQQAVLAATLKYLILRRCGVHWLIVAKSARLSVQIMCMRSSAAQAPIVLCDSKSL